MTAEETTTIRTQNNYIQTPTTTIITATTSPTPVIADELKASPAAAVTVTASAGTVVTAASAAAAIELTENFYINNKRKNNVKIQVKLSGSGIYLRRETEQRNHVNEQLIRIEDIIGSRCGTRLKKRARGGLSSCKRNVNGGDEEEGTSGAQQKDTSAYLYIYAYIKPEKPTSPRHRTVRILRFRSHERFEDNIKSAERWHSAIRANKQLVTIGTMGEVAAAAAAASTVEQQAKPVLILLNPKSGSGKGRELFQKQVAPVLKEAELHYELQVTTHANYARDLIKCRKDLAQSYSGIVVASGDGLFFEVLNGLMERADWRLVCRKVPIGIIPCGSGNGLAKSIAHIYNEPYDSKPIMHAALTCVSGKSAPMDIVRVEMTSKTGDSKITQAYSILSIGWGLIADIDIESESLRSIGSQRFTLWTIRRLISLRTYKGKLWYLPWVAAEATNSTEVPSQKVATESQEKEGEQQAADYQHKLQQLRADQADVSVEFHDPENFEANDLDDFFADAISLDRSSFRPHIDSWHSATSRHTAYYSIAGQSIRSRRSLTASILSKLETANAEFESRIPGPPASTIPALNEPLSNDTWTCEDGEFIMVHAAYTTHLATDCFFAPDSRLNDGIIYLVIIRASCGRSQLLQFLLGLSTGTHMSGTPNEHIQVIPVRAFRIEPQGEDGIMTVDGERVDYGPIQAEIFPSMINVMVPHGK